MSGTHSERAVDGRPVDAVFFDLFGTLLDLSALVGECEAVAPGRGAELATRWRARQLETSWLRTMMDTFVDFDRVTDDALETALAELGLEVPAPALRSLGSAFERLPVHRDAPAVLGRLRTSGVRTGVLTNGSARTLAAVLGRTGLGGMIDHALSVDAVRRYKPDPAVYGLAATETGLDPARIGFVTANGWDAAGAAHVGFRVAWLRPEASARLPPVGAPAALVATWESLVEVLLGEARRR